MAEQQLEWFYHSKYEDFRVEQGGRLGELWGYKMNGYYTVYDPATGTGDLVLNAKGKWELADGVKDKSKDIFGGTYYPGGPKVQCDEMVILSSSALEIPFLQQLVVSVSTVT